MLGFLETWDQAINQWALGLGWPLEGLLRLTLAAACGGLIGLEREVRGRQAGFRTFITVAVGSALVMLVSIQFGLKRWPSPATPGVNVNVDPARIAYGVMTGVGFLGAGVIVHQKGSIRGLTTAASLWTVAAIGLACGFGLYIVSVVASVMIWISLWWLDYFEEILPKVKYRTVTVRLKWAPGCISQTVDRFRNAGMKVVDASFKRLDDMVSAEIDLRIAFTSSKHYYSLERELEGDGRCELMATREI